MIRPGSRLAAPSISSKIGTDDGEFFCQDRCNAMPHEMRLREAVQKQQWPTPSLAADEDRRLSDINRRCLKSVEHSVLSGRGPAAARHVLSAAGYLFAL